MYIGRLPNIFIKHNLQRISENSVLNIYFVYYYDLKFKHSIDLVHFSLVQEYFRLRLIQTFISSCYGTVCLFHDSGEFLDLKYKFIFSFGTKLGHQKWMKLLMQQIKRWFLNCSFGLKEYSMTYYRFKLWFFEKVFFF